MEDFDLNSAKEIKQDSFDINSAVEMDENTLSIYNDNTGNIVNSTFSKPKKINYADLIQFGNKSREEFIGMTNINDGKYGNDFANNYLVSKFLDFSRGFTVYPINLYQSTTRSIAQKVATGYGRLKYKDEDLQIFLDGLDKATTDLKATQQKFIEELGLNKTEKDGLAFDLGGVASNIFTTLALKSPLLVASLFGASQQQELYEETRDSNISRTKAKVLSYGTATLTSAIEYLGTDKLLQALKGNSTISSIVKGALSEGLEEGLQNVVEDIAMTTLGGRDKTTNEILQDTLYSSLLGAIGGAGGAGIGHILLQGKQDLIKNGLNEIQADNKVNKIINTLKNNNLQKEVQDLLINENDNTTYEGNNYVEGAKYIKDLIEKNKVKPNLFDKIKQIETQQEQEAFNTYINNLESTLIQSGYTPEQAKENIKLRELEINYGINNYYDTTISRIEFLNQNNGAVVFNDTRNDLNRKAKGQFNVKTKIIELFKQNDASTFIHENTHWWKQVVEKYANSGSKQAMFDLNIMNKYVAAKTSNWTVEQEEKFANSFVNYLRNGIAPNTSLQATFDKFRNWFVDIFKTSKELKADLSPEIKNLYNRILTNETNELQYENNFNTLQEQINNERELLYQEQPDFTEEEINAILKERFTEQLAGLAELQTLVEKENKKTVKQKVATIFKTYQYDKQEFNELSNKVSKEINNINNVINNMKKDDFKITNEDLAINLKDLELLQKIANQSLPQKPQSLSNWLKSIGGVYDEGGDLAEMEIKGLTRKTKYKTITDKVGRKSLMDLSLDYVMQMALEKGYLQGQDYRDLTLNDFINAISEDVREQNQYTKYNQNKIIEYEERKKQINEAQSILDKLNLDVNEFIDLFSKAKKYNFVLLTKDKIQLIKEENKKVINEVKTILKEIQAKENTIKQRLSSELKTKLTNEIQAITHVKEKVINMINKSNLEADNKIKFLTTIKNITTEKQFINQEQFILDRIRIFEEQEINKLVKTSINRELDQTKDLKQGGKKVGRYEYHDNLLFNDLRKYNKMTKIKLAQELIELQTNTPFDEQNSTIYNIKERFLNYKINGSQTTTEFSIQVLKDITDFKDSAFANKEEIDAIKYNNRKQSYIKIDTAIENSKANKDTIKTKIGNFYRTSISNIYSLINSITNKEIADNLNIELAESNKQNAVYKRTETVKQELINALNLSKENQLYNYINNNRKEKYILYDKVGSKQEINKMFILNIAAEMQNDLKRKQYINEYGEQQINDLLNTLDEYDLNFVKVITKQFNENGDYDKLNKFYIEHFNKDLRRVEGIYIPSKSEYTKETDFFNTFIMDSSNSFSSLKERTAGENSKPIPQDLYNNLMRHINQVEYISEVAPVFKQIEKLLINNNKIKNAIIFKFGKDVFNSLQTQLNALSFITNEKNLSMFEKLFLNSMNNWVVAKIASPVVFIKQLSAVLNYSENVKTIDFTNNLFKGMSKAKETADFMLKNFPMIEVRYKNGFNESLQRAVEMSKMAVLKNNLNYFFTFFTRMGDLASVIYGGYAQIQSDLQNGISQEQAFKNFEIQTIRSQQSGLTSSLSTMQQNAKNSTWTKLFFAFKNQSLQYLRKIYDSIIMYQNGDIDSKQLGKTLTLYMIIQPTIFTYLSRLSYDLFKINDDDDEDEKVAKKTLLSIIKAPMDGLPLLPEIFEVFGNKFIGEKQYNVFSTPLLDDLATAMKRINKNDITTKDYLNFIATGLEITTAVPVKTLNRIQRVFTKEDLLSNK